MPIMFKISIDRYNFIIQNHGHFYSLSGLNISRIYLFSEENFDIMKDLIALKNICKQSLQVVNRFVKLFNSKKLYNKYLKSHILMDH